MIIEVESLKPIYDGKYEAGPKWLLNVDHIVYAKPFEYHVRESKGKKHGTFIKMTTSELRVSNDYEEVRTMMKPSCTSL